jgi:hypothetical protein
VFGQVASGQNNILSPADPKVLRRQARREHKHRASPAERADMVRSELLASICPPIWEQRTGRRRDLPEWFPTLPANELESPIVERVITRLDEFAARWSDLSDGSSITLSFTPSRSHRPRSTHPAA